MKTLLLALALLSLAALAPASRPQPASPRRHINLPRPTDLAAQAPFSDAVLAGDTLYLAGRIGLDPRTGKLPAAPEEEARNVMDQFRAVLDQAGMSFEDVVSVQVFCSDVALFDRFNSVYRGYFKAGRFPARAFLGSGKLLFDARFEVQMIAVRR
jgi:2-iminobutanoate/2-iminopropanoate deaminase